MAKVEAAATLPFDQTAGWLAARAGFIAGDAQRVEGAGAIEEVENATPIVGAAGRHARHTASGGRGEQGDRVASKRGPG